MDTSGPDIPLIRPVKSIFIATESRSGSNYLSAIMATTNSLGIPQEYFSYFTAFENTNTAAERYAYACNYSVSPNGVISVKLFPEHWKMIGKQLDIKDKFPNRYWIWLRRKDILAQAISRDIALQTRAWISNTGAQADPVYSSKNIERCLHFITNSEARWRVYFARNAINPFMLWYEDMIHDPKKAITDIARFTDIEINPASINLDVHTKPQHTKLNEEWKEKFVDEMLNLNRMDNVRSNKKHKFSLKNLILLWQGKLHKP